MATKAKCAWLFVQGKDLNKYCDQNVSSKCPSQMFCCRHSKSGNLKNLPKRPSNGVQCVSKKKTRSKKPVYEDEEFEEVPEGEEGDFEEIPEGELEPLEEGGELEDDFPELEDPNVPSSFSKVKKTSAKDRKLIQKQLQEQEKESKQEDKRRAGWEFGKEEKGEGMEEEKKEVKFAPQPKDDDEVEEDVIEEEEEPTRGDILVEINDQLALIKKMKAIEVVKKAISQLMEDIDYELECGKKDGTY